MPLPTRLPPKAIYFKFIINVFSNTDEGEGLSAGGDGDDEAGDGGAAEVDPAALGEQHHPLAVGPDDVVDLRAHLLPRQVLRLERHDVDLGVGVAHVAHDGAVLQLVHVLAAHDALVAGGSHHYVHVLHHLTQGRTRTRRHALIRDLPVATGGVSLEKLLSTEVLERFLNVMLTSDSLTTWKPSMQACNAQMGSISVTNTTQPIDLRLCAQPFPTWP